MARAWCLVYLTLLSPVCLSLVTPYTLAETSPKPCSFLVVIHPNLLRVLAPSGSNPPSDSVSRIYACKLLQRLLHLVDSSCWCNHGCNLRVLIDIRWPLPVSHDAVVKAVQSVLKGVPNAPQIEVHRMPSDAGLVIPGPMPKGGVLPDGRIVVFSDANTGNLDVVRTVLHELFHRGLNCCVSVFGQSVRPIRLTLSKRISNWKSTSLMGWLHHSGGSSPPLVSAARTARG